MPDLSTQYVQVFVNDLFLCLVHRPSRSRFAAEIAIGGEFPLPRAGGVSFFSGQGRFVRAVCCTDIHLCGVLGLTGLVVRPAGGSAADWIV